MPTRSRYRPRNRRLLGEAEDVATAASFRSKPMPT
jgi:hypothetical protein